MGIERTDRRLRAVGTVDPERPGPPGLGLDPFAPGFFAEPYARYGALRRDDPVHHSALGPWLCTRYEDCVRLLCTPGLSVEDHHAGFDRRARRYAPDDPRRERGTRAILNLDPPDHTRLRRLVARAFTPRRVEALGPRIDALVDRALDAGAGAGGFDVIADLAFPLPFTVISEMLGVPDHDGQYLRDVSHTLVRALEPLVAEDDDAVRVASDAMHNAVEAMIAEKRAAPGDDLLYIAGHETTVNLIGNGVWSLLRHPDQLTRLRADPGLVGNAVEELLRYDAPVQSSRRITRSDVTIGDTTVPAGSFVFTVLGAANRDPAHFGPDADRLDLGRPLAPQHLAFGGGIHHCLGAVLARAEARAAIGGLVQRFPRLAPTDTAPDWNGRLVLRGLESLPVTV